MDQLFKALYGSCILVFLLIGGCAGIFDSYGSIIPNGAVSKEFNSYILRSDYNYYTAGIENYPAIIIGLDKNYILDTQLWLKREFTAETFKSLVDTMNEQSRFLQQKNMGFKIFDNNGNTIGIWYSITKARTGAVVKGNNVTLFTPDPEVYNEISNLRGNL